jgi:MHS family proline/betaine transporter-like MFS transporter
VKSFVIFGSAFLMRPVGGLVIGYIGDKHGRKTALTRSLFMMAIPTTLMGCLPTYEQVGVVSTILLCLCRLVQGISVGGQLPASLVYTVEKRPKSQWGYYGSLPMVAANVGTLLGNLCGALMRQVLNDEQLHTWGWRIPFFSGIIIAFVACYLRRSGADVHTNQGVYDHQNSEVKNPIRVAVRKGNRLALLSTSLAPMLWASGFYVSFVWMAVFMEELLEPPIPGGFWINSATLALGMTWVLPIAGAISDRCGRLRIMTLSGLLLSGLGPIFLIMIAKGNGVVAFFSQLCLGVILSFFGGPLCAWLVENFSPEVRMTSASMGYDIAHAVAGGFSPAMATALFNNVGTYAAGLVYVVFGVVSVFGLWITYCCGGNQKEADSAESKSPSTTPTIGAGSGLELQQNHSGEVSENVKNIV